ncbi:MAG: REDY-like protein HapK [Pseudomonadota bacterium]
MTRIVVLFNLKPQIDPSEYEEWARKTDIPIVNALSSVSSFTVHRSSGLLGSDAAPPYQYVEVIDVSDMETFGGEVGTDTMRQVAAEFQRFADQPQFLLTEDL